MKDHNDKREQLFHAAAELHDPAQRAAFLDAACGDDGNLRAEIEELLRHDDQAGSFLDKPAVAGDLTGAYSPVSEGPGTLIGPYKLLQKIGEGGFGVVFMAEQQQPVRRMVALKIIKPGMDTAQVIARFESERQALALMDHPNIAKVLDAGATSEVRKQSFSRDAESSERSAPSPALTPDSSVLTPDCGRPYFVMELVKGIPITEFCDKNHLPPEHRLKLFIDVCHAIQHAHHKGVIHRDVKPSNVMVTLHDGVPVVKVIDFGVAKATVQKLTERTLFTAYGQMIGTPAYMSPEQAEMSGLDIDTRSDVYSLGVLLYELLTGTTPLESERLREAGYAEMQRLIREEEAPRPSTRFSSLGDSATVLAGNRGLDVRRLIQFLSGDLDWIVMKALEKDRNRRYGTPGNFAEDIERYLKREAILARPPSTIYKMKKFAQRNRTAVYVLTVILLLLGAGIVGTGTGLLHALRAERRARDEAIRAREAEQLSESRLIDVGQERDAANNARAEAVRNARLLERAVAQEESRRLAAHSAAVRSANPGQALLLAILGAEKSPERSAPHNNALLSALRECREERTLFAPTYTTPEGRIGRMAFRAVRVTPDGSSAVVVGERSHDPVGDYYLRRAKDDSAVVYDLHSGKVTASMKLAGLPLATMALSPDGSLLAAATDQGAIVRYADGQTVCFTDRAVRLWNVRTGTEVRVLKGHTDRVSSLCFDNKGERLLSSSFDKTARIWDVATGKVLHVLDGGRVSLAFAEFSPDGRRVLTGSTLSDAWSIGDLAEHIRNQRYPESLKSVPVVIDPPARPDAAVRWLSSLTGSGTQGGDSEAPRLWDAATGARIAVLSTAKEGEARRAVHATAGFSADGDRVVTVGRDKTEVWNSEDGKLVGEGPAATRGSQRTIKTANRVLRVMLNDFGGSNGCARPVIWQSDKDERVWRRARGSMQPARCTWSGGDSGPVLDVSAGGRPLLARVAGNTASVDDMMSGERVAELRGHEDKVTAAAFLPEGTRIVTTSLDGTLRIWSLNPAGDPVIEMKRTDGPAPGSAVLLPGGKQILIAPLAGKSVSLWDTASGRHLTDLLDDAALATSDLHKELLGNLYDLDVSADGERLVSVHRDDNPCTNRKDEPRPSPLYTPVRVWNLQTGKQLFALQGLRRSVATARFSPDGKRLLTFSDGNYHHAIVGDKNRIYGRGSGGQSWARVDVWDAHTGKHLRGIVPEAPGGGSFALWSPDGKRIVTNPFVQIHKVAANIFDADTGKRLRGLKDDLGSIDRAEFSADGKLLLGFRTNTLSRQLQVDVWDTTTGEKRVALRGHSGEVTAAHFSPDGRSIVTTSKDGTARLWDVATGQTRKVLRGHRHVVRAGRFSPDGKWVVTASTDGTARIWNADTGQEWMTLPAATGEMTSAEFTADSQRVLTVSTDGVARIWPIDLLPPAQAHKPRELTAEEKGRYHVE